MNMKYEKYEDEKDSKQSHGKKREGGLGKIISHILINTALQDVRY